MVKGKYAYMSPEQARSAKLDGRSDVFSVGILLWELVTWRRLFKRGTDLATMVAVAEEPAPSMLLLTPDCPQALDDVVQKALAKEADQRYSSAKEFQDALADCMTKLGWDFGQKAVGTYMTEIFRERMVQRESELRAVTNAAKRDSLRQPVGAVQVPQPVVKKQPAVTMPLQVITLPPQPGGKPSVPANLRTTMPFGPAGLQIPRQTRSAAPAGNPGASGANPAIPASLSAEGPSGQMAALRKPTPQSGTPSVPPARRSPSDGIKLRGVLSAENSSMATVPNAALAGSSAKDSQLARRKRVILAISLGVSIGVLAVVLLQIFLSR
jgi:serine/threonine-protein kinase